MGVYTKFYIAYIQVGSKFIETQKKHLKMKNVFFSLAFMLIGSFAFASNNEVKENNVSISNEKVVKTIDFATFKTMVENQQIKIVKKVDFIFYDSCGGAWHVTGGDGWSTGEIMEALLFFDSIVCP